MIKRGISKNYFHMEPSDEQLIFDQRLIDRFLIENKDPRDSGLDYNNIETKILIYEDRVKGWFLEIGEKLKQDNEAGFVIIQIALSCMEGNQQYIEGEISRNRSKLFFIKSMKRIFPDSSQVKNIDEILGIFYDQVRCGLFHDGMTRSVVTINAEHKSAIDFTSSDIVVNPHKFLDSIRKAFEDYIMELKNPSNTALRQNFEKRWNIIN